MACAVRAVAVPAAEGCEHLRLLLLLQQDALLLVDLVLLLLPMLLLELELLVHELLGLHVAPCRECSRSWTLLPRRRLQLPDPLLRLRRMQGLVGALARALGVCVLHLHLTVRESAEYEQQLRSCRLVGAPVAAESHEASGLRTTCGLWAWLPDPAGHTDLNPRRTWRRTPTGSRELLVAVSDRRLAETRHRAGSMRMTRSSWC